MLIVPLLISSSCNRQDGADTSYSDIKGLPVNYTVQIIDTIKAQNAPVRITRKIRKDSDGNLLFAAFEDVIRFDGKIFSRLPKVEGFESVDALDALEDSKGNIWMASTHHGVFRFDGKTFAHFTTTDGLAHNRTMDIYEDKAGNIWIATMGGVSCYNGNTFQNFTTEEGMTNNDVNTILEDGTGKFWFGTRVAVCVYDPASSLFTEITTSEGEPLLNVWSIIEDHQGSVWLIGKEGIWRNMDNSISLVSDQGGGSLYQHSNGDIWFTHGNGLSVFSRESLSLNNPEATEVFVGEGMFFGISEDKEGSIWVGTLRGAFTYAGKSIHYYNGEIAN